MHVLITSDTVGGVWTYTQELVTGLAQRGHKITLVSFGKVPSPDQSAWLRNLDNVDYRPTEYRLEWMEVAERDIEESRRYLKMLVSEVQPDVLHFSQYCYGDIDVSVPRVVVAHSDVVSWWVGVHGSEPDDSPWIQTYRKHVEKGLRGADLVVAPSQWMLDAVCRHYLQPQHGAVVYNGRSPALFNPGHDKEDISLSVGRIWDEAKNVQLLLHADEALATRIVGWAQEPGREKKALPACPPNVELLGPKSQDELRYLYAAASIYVATSRYEPFGLSPLEAALSGCALVMNDIPVFHELWADSALYFRQNDSRDLTQLIVELKHSPGLREHYGARAYRTACEKFTASRMVDQYENAYERVALHVARYV
jgi:glycosyltransferase involved in cell wall biosynthesis